MITFALWDPWKFRSKIISENFALGIFGEEVSGLYFMQKTHTNPF